MRNYLILGLIIVALIIIFGITQLGQRAKPQMTPSSEKNALQADQKTILAAQGEVLSTKKGGFTLKSRFLGGEQITEEKTHQVLVNKETEFVKVIFADFAPGEEIPPPEKVEATIEDIRAGDTVLVHARENITGQSPINARIVEIFVINK